MDRKSQYINEFQLRFNTKKYYKNKIKIYNTITFTMDQTIITSASFRPNIVVISFGGGIFGNVDKNGFVTSSDLIGFWTYQGLTSFPTVQLKLLNGVKNAPTSDLGSTMEITNDLLMLGEDVPNSNLILIITDKYR
jgi:hypothetical protein